jgi:hypothetical protein
MLPEVLGYDGGLVLGTVLPGSPVCCLSEFFPVEVADGPQAFIAARTMMTVSGHVHD